jgi:hypothetical protein
LYNRIAACEFLILDVSHPLTYCTLLSSLVLTKNPVSIDCVIVFSFNSYLNTSLINANLKTISPILLIFLYDNANPKFKSVVPVPTL